MSSHLWRRRWLRTTVPSKPVNTAMLSASDASARSKSRRYSTASGTRAVSAIRASFARTAEGTPVSTTTPPANRSFGLPADVAVEACGERDYQADIPYAERCGRYSYPVVRLGFKPG